MRRFGIVLLALACVSFSAPAWAAIPGGITFGVDGGAAIPMGDFSDGFKTGWNGGAFLDFALASVIEIGADGSYNRFDAKDLAVGATDARVSIIQGGGHIKLSTPYGQGTMPVMPYVQAGLGWYQLKSEATVLGVDVSDTQNKLGFSLGAGFDYRATPQVGAGIFATWHGISDAYKVEEFDDLNNVISSKNRMANYFAVGLKLSFGAAPASATGGTGGGGMGD
jgi:opacity protein-like surface antigen